MLIYINLMLSFLAYNAIPDQSERLQDHRILKFWDFDDLGGWNFGNEILNPIVKDSILEFTAEGSDPILYGPEYDPIPASNHQKIQIRLKAESNGIWELFYANTNEGRFGGYSQEQSLRFHVPASKDWQIVNISPFWGALGKTIKFRLDPANGHHQIDWIRIVETIETPSAVTWKSHKWLADTNVESIKVDGEDLVVRASEDGCMFLTYVDIYAEKDSILYYKVKGKDLGSINFCWANNVTSGLHSAGIKVNSDDCWSSANVDLSKFDNWKGRIDVIGFVFGQTKDDELSLNGFGISNMPQGRADIELISLIAEPVIRRQGQIVEISAYVRNTGGETFQGGNALLITAESTKLIDNKEKRLPSLELDKNAVIKWKVIFNESGNIPIKIEINDTWKFSGKVRVEPAITVYKTDYVPEPKPIDTSPYEIGVYYFPGWSPDQWDRWSKQKGFPERDPVLGFYREGDPEVADWHIKWAVENGITFFMYDWYWRNGKIALENGLENGYLKSKYRDYIKFCIMWANHAPFHNHTINQLLEVTDYWIEKYFILSCYYKIDNKPVVSFFDPNNLTHDLGGSDNVRKAFSAMRKRVQSKGFDGIYFIACGDNSPSSQKRFKQEGYDAISAYNYPTAGARSQWSSYKSMMLAHVDIWNNSLKSDILPYIPLLTDGWDSRPWHGNKAIVRFGRTTEYFKTGLEAMKKWMDENHRYIGLIEAWNEWGEGSYIEPNSEFGFGDIEAIREVFGKSGEYPKNIAPSDVGLGPYDISIIDHELIK
ncbi:MAG: glycoside hydrolase family 99-like domain-containing protein [bacterium]